ncbi:MAG TPA: type II secretion system F family protein [Pirellulaceae bacterium]|nr:type II secretion system F family protein [Pirellulaceae bacterium]
MAFIPLMIFGIVLIWCARLVYSARRGPSDDPLKLCLNVGGWLLVLIGGAAFTLVMSNGVLLMLLPLYIVVALATLHRYRESERQALIWTIAHAAQQGVPLATAVRAFAMERSDEIGARCWRLASALEAGQPLDVALSTSANRVPLEVLVAARMGTVQGNLPRTLLKAVDQSRDFDRGLNAFLERLLFLLFGFTWFVLIVTFVMLKIVPTMEYMFREFELELPIVTRLIIALSNVCVSNAYLLIFLMPLILLGIALATLHYVGWLPWNMPGIGWLRISYDRTVLLRALAQAVDKKQSFERALAQLAEAFPTNVMRRRLKRVLAAGERGIDTFTALRRARLITRYEQAVLSAAQRVGNLSWALDEMADSALVRLTNRLRRASNAILVLMFVCLSLLVFLFAVGMIAPLSSLVLNLS